MFNYILIKEMIIITYLVYLLASQDGLGLRFRRPNS